MSSFVHVCYFHRCIPECRCKDSSSSTSHMPQQTSEDGIKKLMWICTYKSHLAPASFLFKPAFTHFYLFSVIYYRYYYGTWVRWLVEVSRGHDCTYSRARDCKMARTYTSFLKPKNAVTPWRRWLTITAIIVIVTHLYQSVGCAFHFLFKSFSRFLPFRLQLPKHLLLHARTEWHEQTIHLHRYLNEQQREASRLPFNKAQQRKRKEDGNRT